MPKTNPNPKDLFPQPKSIAKLHLGVAFRLRRQRLQEEMDRIRDRAQQMPGFMCGAPVSLVRLVKKIWLYMVNIWLIYGYPLVI
jgi:hypothetical protein